MSVLFVVLSGLLVSVSLAGTPEDISGHTRPLPEGVRLATVGSSTPDLFRRHPSLTTGPYP